MHRKNRQNRITENKKIQKRLRRMTAVFLLITGILLVGNLTGCGSRNADSQPELIGVEEEPDASGKEDTKDDTREDDDQKEEPEEASEKGLKICYVHVCGAVNSPGVYQLTADSRLYEAIKMAGGLTDEAAGEALNQAEPVEDGSRIYVPTKEEAENGSLDEMTSQDPDNGQTESAEADGKVNINTAQKAELMTLSGIGEAKAEAIIRYREEHGAFQKIEDLMGVEGIKDGVFQKVKDQIKV